MNWLNSKYLNLSAICRELYGKSDKNTTGKFFMKKTGRRPWNHEELERLKDIHKEVKDSN